MVECVRQLVMRVEINDMCFELYSVLVCLANMVLNLFGIGRRAFFDTLQPRTVIFKLFWECIRVCPVLGGGR